MAEIKNLAILNPADKTRMYSVAIGEGAPTEKTDRINTDVTTFPIGSQYTDISGGKFYVRTGKTAAPADWKEVGGAASASGDNGEMGE